MNEPRCLIIGGGLAGCSVASHVSRSGRVLLLEQGERLGAEASSQNAGMVRRLGEDPYERCLALRTWEALEEISRESERAVSSRRTGAWIGLRNDPHHLHDAVAHLRARGVEVVGRGAGGVPPLAGDAAWSAAWWLPDERVVHAPSLVAYLAGTARDHGAHLETGVQVERLWLESGRCVGVHTADGPIRADKVVLAGGAWCAGLAAEAGLYRPLMPVRRSVYRSTADERATEEHPWVWVDDEGVYARPFLGTWLISPCDEHLCWPESGAGSRTVPEVDAEALLRGKLAACLPELEGLTWSEAWAGLRTFAPDRRPGLGEDPALPGLWWAAGMGGFGVSCSMAVGEVLAAWMRGEEVSWMDSEGVSPGRDYPVSWPIREQGAIGRARLIKASMPPVG